MALSQSSRSNVIVYGLWHEYLEDIVGSVIKLLKVHFFASNSYFES